jgi:bifunctional non-homologous end joining protein LigD
MAAVPGRLPLVEPMLATPVRDVPFDEENWSAEAKWDGARVLAYLSGGSAVLRGRSGQDVTGSYPEVAAALARAAGRRTLILDGELTAFGGDRPSFALLQRRLHVARPAAALVAAVPVTFIAFDLLHQASRSLLRSPYAQRRALLDGLVLAEEHVSVPPAFPGQASALTQASRELGLEGVVLKRLASDYQPGHRSGDWLKIRHLAAAYIVIGGWLPGTGSRSAIAGSVLAGLPGADGSEPFLFSWPLLRTSPLGWCTSLVDGTGVRSRTTRRLRHTPAARPRSASRSGLRGKWQAGQLTFWLIRLVPSAVMAISYGPIA